MQSSHSIVMIKCTIAINNIFFLSRSFLNKLPNTLNCLKYFSKIISHSVLSYILRFCWDFHLIEQMIWFHWSMHNCLWILDIYDSNGRYINKFVKNIICTLWWVWNVINFDFKLADIKQTQRTKSCFTIINYAWYKI